MSEEITRRLREAAEAREPDRDRIAARVRRGAAGPVVRHRARPFARSGLRALATLGAVGVLATGGLAVADIIHITPAPKRPAPVQPTPTLGAPWSAAPSRTPSAPRTDPAVVLPTAPGTAHSTPPAADQTRNGPLWSVGSVDPGSTVYWAQSDLALRTTQPLTALTVELRIAQTGDVRSTGYWQTLPGADFTVTVQQVGATLVYRWVLKPGSTVPAGQHRFAAQFNHATGGRNPAGDAYRVDAQAPGGPASVSGRFTATR
jgi:hypothetical protein